MATLESIGVLFSAKLQAIVMAGVGLVAGILYAGLGAIYDVFKGQLGFGTALAYSWPSSVCRSSLQRLDS